MTSNRLDELLGLNPGQISSALSLCESCRYTRRIIRRGRIVWAPRQELRVVQRSVCRFVQPRFQPHRIAHAYARRRSIKTNAEQHVGKTLLLHVDLKNFFASITVDAVVRKLHELFSELDLADIEALADLCCLRGRLPQGAPSSPILSNLVCQDLDEGLEILGKSFGFDPSRYSDDMAFSTNDEEFAKEIVKIHGHGKARQIEVGTALRELIERQGFSINPRKLRFQTRSDRQQVTGLTVNDGVSVPIEFRRGIRAQLNRWKTLGLGAAAKLCTQGTTPKEFVWSLEGRIGFIRQVRGQSCRHYQRFLHEFAELKARDTSLIIAARRLSPRRGIDNVDNLIAGFEPPDRCSMPPPASRSSDATSVQGVCNPRE
jgi:RNA-directed DNA polymerase